MNQTPLKRKLVRTAAGFRSKAVRYGTTGDPSADDLARIYLAANGRCYYCNADLDPMFASYDHVTPFERGGSNEVTNIVLSCLTDNRQKYTMNEAEYRDWLALERVCPIDGTKFKPRAADYRRGYGFYCSRKCSGTVGGLAPT